MTAIEFKNVNFAYESEDERSSSPVLRDFSIKIEKGAFVALLGRNGSGKSTLAKLVNGLLTPDSGSITVLGYDACKQENLFEIRKLVGMVFQNPDNQQVASIVEDDIAFGPENVGVEREEIGRRIDYALKATDMEEFRHCEVSRLSGGQKQRIAIAGALALLPEILILDESTSMLDPKGRAEILSVVRTLNKEKNITVIDVTHYMDEAAEADEIFVLCGGKILKSGSPREIFADEEVLNSAGLALPRPALLAKRLKAAGLKISDDILKKEELAEALCKSLQKT